MKILFVYPNSAGYTRIPIGLATIITCLKRAGHVVRVFDTSFYKLKEKTDDELREHLGQVKKTDLSQYGVVLEAKTKQEVCEDLRDVITSFAPGLCAFTVNEELMAHACELAHYIKQQAAIPIIFGGIGVTTAPEEVIGKPFVDMICVGEGEEAIVELADALESGKDFSGIRNLWTKINSHVVRNDVRPLIDVNALPFVDLDDFSDKHFFRPFDGRVYRMVMFDMIRGCPHRCSYCDNHMLQDLYRHKGTYVRKKAKHRAISELVYLKDRYKIEVFFFIDDDFCIQSEDEMADFLEAYRSEVGIPFIVQGRPSTASEKKLRELKRSGCITIAMSIESGSPGIRERVMNRHIANEVVAKAFQAARRAGLKANAQNIIGSPEETRHDIFETIQLNRQCQPHSISTNFMTPFKGTKLRQACLENGYINPDFTVTTGIRGRPMLRLPQISNEELIGLQKVFALYIKLPRALYPIIRYCERGRWGAGFLYGKLIDLMWSRST